MKKIDERRTIKTYKTKEQFLNAWRRIYNMPTCHLTNFGQDFFNQFHYAELKNGTRFYTDIRAHWHFCIIKVVK